MALSTRIGLGLMAVLIAACGGTGEAQRPSGTATVSRPDAWASDWATFVREVESQNQKPAAEFNAFIKKYEGKQVRWAGTIEYATCESGTCSMTLRMTPDSVKLSPTSTYLAQILLSVTDPGRKLEPGTRVSFRTTLRSAPEPLLMTRGLRLMVLNDGGELLADNPK